MEAMRQSRSDDRLDDLSSRVNTGFDRVDLSIARLDAKIDASTTELRQEMKMGFDQINARFDAMQQTMLRASSALIGVFAASGAGLIATQL
jgi:hypothetical protein